MDRVTTYTTNSQVLSADLNGIQDRAAGLLQLVGTWIGRKPDLVLTASPALEVRRHRGVVVGTTAGNSVLLPASAGQAITTGTLSNSTWYYVYAYNGGSYSSPAIAYEVSTTAPDASLSIKNGDASRAYLGCFYSDSGGAIRRFDANGASGQVRYRLTALTGGRDDVKALDAVGNVAYTDLDLSAWVPDHAKSVVLGYKVDGAIGTFAQVRPDADTTDAFDLPALLATPGMMHGIVEVPLPEAGTAIIENRKNTASFLTLYVLGWNE